MVVIGDGLPIITISNSARDVDVLRLENRLDELRALLDTVVDRLTEVDENLNAHLREHEDTGDEAFVEQYLRVLRRIRYDIDKVLPR